MTDPSHDATTPTTTDPVEPAELAAEPRQFRQHRFAPPPGACEILLVRHGESAPAVEGEAFPLMDGHGDPPLADEGHEQALCVARPAGRER